MTFDEWFQWWADRNLYYYGNNRPDPVLVAKNAWDAAAQAVRREVIEECAKVCDRKDHYNWASENADRYRIQDEWAAHLAKRIRNLK